MTYVPCDHISHSTIHRLSSAPVSMPQTTLDLPGPSRPRKRSRVEDDAPPAEQEPNHGDDSSEHDGVHSTEGAPTPSGSATATTAGPPSKRRRSKRDMDALRSLRDSHGDWLTVACGYCEDTLSLEDVDACSRHVMTHFAGGELHTTDGAGTLCGWGGGCQSRLLSSGALERHFLETHILPPMVCESCGEAFTRVSSLDRHRERGKCVSVPSTATCLATVAHDENTHSIRTRLSISRMRSPRWRSS